MMMMTKVCGVSLWSKMTRMTVLEKIMTKMSSCKRRTKLIYCNFYFIINSSGIQRLDSLFMGQGWHSNHSTCPPSSVSGSTPGYSITWVEFLGSLLCCTRFFLCIPLFPSHQKRLTCSNLN